jgi:hypothetical protein
MKSTPRQSTPAYAGNTRRRVRCQSGIMGERSRLRSRYSSLSEFIAYQQYGLAKRLGFASPELAWKANPVIESSVNPSDFRVVSA